MLYTSRKNTIIFSDCKKIGLPNASRAVGTACKLNPIPLFVPCHRVIKQDQSVGQFALGVHNKKYLLRIEGVKYDYI